MVILGFIQGYILGLGFRGGVGEYVGIGVILGLYKDNGE